MEEDLKEQMIGECGSSFRCWWRGLVWHAQPNVAPAMFPERMQSRTALTQADLKDVTVTEDSDKNTITLGGTVYSDDAKQRAGEVAKTAAGDRVVANEVSVQPVSAEWEAKDIASSTDDAIEKNLQSGPDLQRAR